MISGPAFEVAWNFGPRSHSAQSCSVNTFRLTWDRPETSFRDNWSKFWAQDSGYFAEFWVLEGESLRAIIRRKFCISGTKLLFMATRNVWGDDETRHLMSLWGDEQIPSELQDFSVQIMGTLAQIVSFHCLFSNTKRLNLRQELLFPCNLPLRSLLRRFVRNKQTKNNCRICNVCTSVIVTPLRPHYLLLPFVHHFACVQWTQFVGTRAWAYISWCKRTMSGSGEAQLRLRSMPDL